MPQKLWKNFVKHQFVKICLSASIVSGLAMGTARAQSSIPDHPTVTIAGKSYTPLSVVTRNMGTEVEQTAPLGPYKIIDNVYYVGTKTLSSYLITTSAGNILMDTTYERNVPTIQKSVEKLGFKFSDIKFVLGNHAHVDHMEGDALVKELTGAQVVVMAEDAPALRNIKPGGKEHPIDRIIHDMDTLSLGGTTLTAHLTPGHTRGCTTWTMKAQEGGRTYDVVFHCSLRVSGQTKVLTPAIVAEFDRTYPLVRSIPCDVPLGDHPSQYGLNEKYAKMTSGGPNPFIDPAGCNLETDLEQAMFFASLLEQEQNSQH